MHITHTHMHTYVHVLPYIYILIYALMDTHHAAIRGFIHKYICTYAHPYPYININADIYTCIITHMHTRHKDYTNICNDIYTTHMTSIDGYIYWIQPISISPFFKEHPYKITNLFTHSKL